MKLMMMMMMMSLSLLMLNLMEKEKGQYAFLIVIMMTVVQAELISLLIKRNSSVVLLEMTTTMKPIILFGVMVERKLHSQK